MATIMLGGETGIKNNYSWETYNYCAGNYWSCQDIGDNIAGTRYDVARQKWGGTWRLPTKAEVQELCDGCVWTWVTQGNKRGQKVTSKKNGKSIFLPAAGCFNGTTDHSVNSTGFYWCAMTGDEKFHALSLRIYENNAGHHLYNLENRFLGASVRPVSD